MSSFMWWREPISGGIFTDTVEHLPGETAWVEEGRLCLNHITSILPCPQRDDSEPVAWWIIILQVSL